MKKEIDILELFSGIGGFTKGFQEAGYTIKKHRFSEIDKHAIANYKYNFKDAESIGSVTDVSGSGLRADVITFGSQPQQQNRVYDANGLMKTLGNDTRNNVQIPHISRTDEAKEHRKLAMKNGKDHTPFQGKKLEWKNGDVINTITCATQKDNLIKQNQIRRLTEIECERLQGFPDDWTKFGNYDGIIKEIPKTQRYKLCGNAVSVPAPKAIAQRLKIF